MTRIGAIIAAAAVLTTGNARAETLPLWEAGAGLAVAYLPDYRGSEEARAYLLPFPYFIYRGDFLKADREGVRARFFDSERVELDLSFGATVPVRSNKNRARAGMPDLRPTLEVGPVLKIFLIRDVKRDNPAPAGFRPGELELRLPVRRALTWQDGGVKDAGTLFFPHVNLDRKFDWAGRRFNLGTLAGVQFGDRRYHDYFYGVAPANATAERPAYSASGGYAGWQAIAALSATAGRIWVGGFVKLDSVRGAVFDDSPLVRRNTNFSAGIGASYVFARSSQQVSE